MKPLRIAAGGRPKARTRESRRVVRSLDETIHYCLAELEREFGVRPLFRSLRRAVRGLQRRELEREREVRRLRAGIPLEEEKRG